MKPRLQCDADVKVRQRAAEWVVRRDRGLSTEEAIEFELWLATDRRHVAAMRCAGAIWSMLERMPQETARASRRQTGLRRRVRRGALWANLAQGTGTIWTKTRALARWHCGKSFCD